MQIGIKYEDMNQSLVVTDRLVLKVRRGARRRDDSISLPVRCSEHAAITRREVIEVNLSEAVDSSGWASHG